MKNKLDIDAINSCACNLVSSVDDGTNKIVLEIDCDTSLNPYLKIGSTTVTLTQSPYEYEIPSSLIVAGTTITFSIGDDNHTGSEFSIQIPSKPADNWILKQVSNFVYKVSEKLTNTEMIQTLLSMVYPVGSIYMSANNVSPQSFLGGTWVAWGSGRVPVGVNTGDSNFSSTEKTGGVSSNSFAHSHTVNSHTHTVNGHTHTTSAVALTAAQLPAISGTILAGAGSGGASDGGYGAFRSATGVFAASGEHQWAHSKATSTYSATWPDSAVSYGLITMSFGGGQTHSHGNTGSTALTTNAAAPGTNSALGTVSNLQPYITCYMWKRTA